jgi:hypothetical protein
MVFRSRSLFPLIGHRTDGSASRPRIPATEIVAILFLLASCFIPVSADDGPVAGIPCHSPRITNIISSTTPTGYAPLTITFTPQVTDCYECGYLWSITESVAGGLGTNYYHERELTHTFAEPGGYTVQLRIFENMPACTGETSEATAYQSVNLHAPPSIVTPTQNVNCPDISTMTLEVRQTSDSTALVQYPSGSRSVQLRWFSSLSGSCPTCVYTWSIYKMTDTFEPVSLGSGDILARYDGAALQHTFNQPGTYKIYLRMTNADSCPYTGDSRPYLPASVIHHVTDPVATPTIPIAMAIPPDDLTEVTLSPPVAPGSAPVNPGVSATTAVPAPAPAQLQAANTILPMATQLPVTVPQGTWQPAGTPVPALANADNPAANAAPGVTTAVPGGSGAAGVSPVAAPLGTTRTPGFALGITLCAGLLVMTLRKK